MIDNFYSLRNNFCIIGLTGRAAAGCSNVAYLLSQTDFLDDINQYQKRETDNIDQLKLNICSEYLKNNNWEPFQVINYKDVLLLHLFLECTPSAKTINKAIKNIFFSINTLGIGKETERLDKVSDLQCFEKLESYLLKNNSWFWRCKNFDKGNLRNYIGDEFYNFYFTDFANLSRNFYSILNEFNLFKRALFIHDIAASIREKGFIRYPSKHDKKAGNRSTIYAVAETINTLIKIYKRHNSKCKIVIDSLKNSLELMYFKEKYSAFYTIAINRREDERLIELTQNKIKKYSSFYDDRQMEKFGKDMIALDETEYESAEVNNGDFSSPDVENCIQKSDYHIYYSDNYLGKCDLLPESKEIDRNYNNIRLMPQLVKLVALISQPGLVSPTIQERIMQFAFSAKLNSGCISRQVGAVVTDSNYSIKAIGWNDVPENQVPCNLRNVNDLIEGKNLNHFSDFEKGIESPSFNYKDGEKFKEKLINVYSDVDMKSLHGKNCSFCFKSCHNEFEGKDNQVHTRSLHAEENAMMQISKYGGQSLKGGTLFTTASPCELCAKKAFQLGLTKIFYIDPYPGISRVHILKGGGTTESNPSLIMFQGAIGKGYHKLYEPFMPFKDEFKIITKVSFGAKNNKKQMVNNLTSDPLLRQRILNLLTNKED